MERRQQRRSSKLSWRVFTSRSLQVKILLAAIGLAIVSFLIVNVLIWTTDVSKLEEPAPQPTFIFDQKGEVASKIASSNIEGVSIEKIPEDVLQAVIATEDQRFYKHEGINYFAIVKALIKNTLSGEIVAGGSTLTQQLAKNAFLTQERTYTRKLKEVIITKKIEREYSKDEIIERYLNQIYFGEGAWGIQRAAQTYFGKDVSELTLSESAMIAGLIKAPSILSPFKDMERSVERRDLVLALMKNEGYITQKELEEAKEQSIVLEGKKIDGYKGKYPYYVDHIIEEAIEKYGLTENEILSGGLRIYTELNPVVQSAAEEVYNDNALFPESQSDQLIQSGAAFINPATGGITALVGGRGEKVFRGFNRATQLERQPGSTMKPLAAYTPALEMGYDIYDTLQDRPITIDGHQPLNYDKQFRGEVSMYEAVIRSYNIPPVWLLQKMGVEYGVNSVERFGIKLEEKDQTAGLPLGGLQKGVSPLTMADAYSAFANQGVRNEAHSIVKIEDAEGNVIANWKKNALKVTDPQVAEKITYMLKGVVEEGTGRTAKVSGWDIAGKTGTTELPFSNEGGTKDHWFVGYSPQIVGAVWMGYDQTDENHFLTESSGSTVTKIFNEIFSRSTSVFTDKDFDLSSLEDKYRDVRKEEEENEREEEENEREEEEEDEKDEEEDEKDEKDNEKEEKQEEKERAKEEKEKEKEEKKKEKKEKKNDD
jgi:penicillin-binding protein 2A